MLGFRSIRAQTSQKADDRADANAIKRAVLCRHPAELHPRSNRQRVRGTTGQFAMTPDSELEARRRRTVLWVVGLATLGLIFDGYDLVVYGAAAGTAGRLSLARRASLNEQRQDGSERCNSI
jgi:hypothetical protein